MMTEKGHGCKQFLKDHGWKQFLLPEQAPWILSRNSD
jgi:hypothetical protein